MLLVDAIYLLILAVASPWLVWRRVRLGKNRRGFAQKFLGHAPDLSGDQPTIWLHAVSVGEVNLLPGIIAGLRQRIPGCVPVVSTTTETGYDLAVKKFPNETVFFFPFDFSWAVRNALNRVNPRMVVLAELELWPNLLKACQNRCVPVAVINARMSDRSHRRFQRFRWLAGRMLCRLNLVIAQTEDYARKFVELGVPAEHAVVSGNLKFDNANTNRDSEPIGELRRQLALHPGETVFVAGSTQPDEDELVLKAWENARQNFPGLRLVVVPRHPHNVPQFCRLLVARGHGYCLRSEFPDSSPDPNAVIVVDVIGELASWWGIASVGFVGGSMGSRGGQNMIEPAALAVPVCFGPNTSNFRDVVNLLLACQGATVVHNEVELTDFVRTMLGDPAHAASVSKNAIKLVSGSRGAIERTVDSLSRLFESQSSTSCRRAA